jgi:hypothetical protein
MQKRREKQNLEDYKDEFVAREDSENRELPKNIDLIRFLGCGG